MKILAAGLLLLSCGAAPTIRPSTQPTTGPAAKHTPFVAVLMRDWDKWDANHDGTLSIDEIDRAVLDPNIKGEDAAVAGTLKLLSRSTKVKVPSLTRDYFTDYDRRALDVFSKLSRPLPTPAAAEAVTTDTVASATPTTMPTGDSLALKKLPLNWDLYFIAGLKRIARGGGGGGSALSWPTKFQLDDMRQGPLGDCFLVATIGSMVVHHPAEVGTLIQPLSDGEYRVTFPNFEPFTIRPLTQAQLVLSSTSSGDGVWLAAVEQAFGKFREKQKGTTDEEGTDIIANGGQPGLTMAQLTGHQYRRVHFALTAQRRRAEEARMLPMLRQELISAFKENRLITASVTPPILTPTTRPTTAPTTGPAATPVPTPVFTPAVAVLAKFSPTTRPAAQPTTRPALTAAMLPRIPPDINTKHAYAVLSYDPATDMLEIWNPHGQSFKPKGPDGLLNGYTTVHGRFHVPLKEAATFFTAFTFELATPASQPTTQPAKPLAAVVPARR